MSAPEQNRLVSTTPSITSFFNHLTLSDFEQFDSIVMELQVTSTMTDNELTCSVPAKCNVIYSWDYTPVIYYMVPAMVYPGML